jgi:hypothetical protein
MSMKVVLHREARCSDRFGRDRVDRFDQLAVHSPIIGAEEPNATKRPAATAIRGAHPHEYLRGVR